MKLVPRYDGPPIISIEGRPDDQFEPVSRQRRRLQDLLAALGADDWATPSRCDGWTVQDVVAHLVGVNTFWEVSVSAGLAGTPTRMLRDFDPAATPQLMVAPMRTLTAAEVLDQFVASNDAFLGAITELDERQWSMLAETPPGHLPVRLLVHHALWDCWIHERDIALPLGSTPAIEADEVSSCLRYVAALGPALASSTGRPCTGTFAVATTGPEVRFELEVGQSAIVRNTSTSPDAPCLHGDAVDVVEALSLRAPLPSSAPAEWHEVVAGLASAFAAPNG
jgi:uncharacterized protein (TIGR03083 family)